MAKLVADQLNWSSTTSLCVLLLAVDEVNVSASSNSSRNSRAAARVEEKPFLGG